MKIVKPVLVIIDAPDILDIIVTNNTNRSGKFSLVHKTKIQKKPVDELDLFMKNDSLKEQKQKQDFNFALTKNIKNFDKLQQIQLPQIKIKKWGKRQSAISSSLTINSTNDEWQDVIPGQVEEQQYDLRVADLAIGVDMFKLQAVEYNKLFTQLEEKIEKYFEQIKLLQIQSKEQFLKTKEDMRMGYLK